MRACTAWSGPSDVRAIDAARDSVALSGHDEDDADGDHVGDVCDPHPGLGVDRIAYFDPLLTFAQWEAINGTWTATGTTTGEIQEAPAGIPRSRSTLRPAQTLGGPPTCIGVNDLNSSANVMDIVYPAPITSARVGMYAYAGSATFTSVTVFDTR